MCGADGADAVAAWSETQGIETANGAVFLMDPDSNDGGSVVVAQLTIPVLQGVLRESFLGTGMTPEAIRGHA